MTYTQMKEYLEQELQCTCTKRAMEKFMQQPFADMEKVSIETLQKEDFLIFLRAAYADRPHISLYALRMQLAVRCSITADNVTMRTFMGYAPRCGLGRRLRIKTSPTAPLVVNSSDLGPYLNVLYKRIADDPKATVQGLSDIFVASIGKFFYRPLLTAVTARLKRRHAIFLLWQEELARDCGLVSPGQLASVDPPMNMGSMSDYEFFQLFDCAKCCHRCGHRTFPSFGCPPILSGSTKKKHKMATALSHVCRPSCGSSIPELETEGPLLSSDGFYCMPQLSDWPRYDEVNDVFTLLGTEAMLSLLDLPKEERYALVIINLYCTSHIEKCGKAIPNRKK